MAKYVELGEICKSKAGNDYIKLTNYDKVVITVNGKKVNGASVFLNSPEDKYRRLNESGHMSEQEAEDAIARIPDYVLEVLTLKLED